ncbi:hypothetical protein NFH98_20815 [Halomonas sp. H33-56]|uniref:hypothetical protein n=1 Tax=Halomonas sp. H33-56 TaxID=2950873 RepID=UPI0032DF2850
MIGALVKRLTGPLLPWLLLAAVVVIGGLAWRADALSDDLADMAIKRDRAEEAAEVARTALAWQAEQVERMAEAIKQRDARIARGEQAIAERREALRRLEDDDATSDWTADPVPAGVRQWVRDLSIGPDVGDDVSGGAGTHDHSAARADAGRDP